ncbi:COG3909 Cytochrome c556 [Rhabdaerophilaceae bacterium]
MRRSVLVASIVAVGLSAAYAQSNAIADRKAVFKSWGDALRPVGPMLRGEAAFELAKAQDAVKLIAAKAPDVSKLFPAGSGTGDTKALPNIWTDNAKFLALFTKVEADAKAAMAAIKDEASFKSEMPKVLGNCGVCHNEFRAK